MPAGWSTGHHPDADVDEAPERYLVLSEPWQSLSAGTLLLVSGNTAAIISTQEANKEATQAERMLTFLDYLPFDAGRNALVEPGIEAQEPSFETRAFMESFGASSRGEALSEATLAAWKGVLPDLLLALWRRDGFARYRDDRLILVDPHLYSGVVAAFLQGTPMEGADRFHAYAVTPFGQMLLCGENTSMHISIDPTADRFRRTRM